MRRATWSERVTAPPVTIFTSGSVISGGEGHVGMVSCRVGVELLGVVGGVVGDGVSTL